MSFMNSCCQYSYPRQMGYLEKFTTPLIKENPVDPFVLSLKNKLNYELETDPLRVLIPMAIKTPVSGGSSNVTDIGDITKNFDWSRFKDPFNPKDPITSGNTFEQEKVANEVSKLNNTNQKEFYENLNTYLLDEKCTDYSNIEILNSKRVDIIAQVNRLFTLGYSFWICVGGCICQSITFFICLICAIVSWFQERRMIKEML